MKKSVTKPGQTSSTIYIEGLYEKETNPEKSPKFKHKFTGKELDEETGLYDYGARMYDAKIGRFISPDTTDPELENPQTLNRYSYGLNNPLRYNDPTGDVPVDTVLDIATTAFDIHQLIQRPSKENLMSVGIDIGAMAIPYVSATMIKGGMKALAKSNTLSTVTKMVGKLSDKIVDTFRGGKYTAITLKSDMKAYRVFGGKSTLKGTSEGIFLSAQEYKTSRNAQKFLALPDTNLANKIGEVTVPKGTKVYVGKAESIFKKPGGGPQIFVKDKTVVNFGNIKELK